MPRAGFSGQGAFTSGSGGFSSPFSGSSGGRGGPVLNDDTGSGGTGERDSGVTPGGFSLDLTSPGAFVAAMQQNQKESEDFITGLGSALFGKDSGSLFGGIPLVGDLGRFAGENPAGQLVGAGLKGVTGLPGHAADAVGGALEHITLPGHDDLSGRFQAMPDGPAKQKAQKLIETDPGAAQHFMFAALREQAEDDQFERPKLFVGADVPTGSLADTVTRLFDILGTPQRLAERSLAGTAKATTGMNRLQEIEAIAAGGTPTGILGTGFLAGKPKLTDVEQTALLKWQSGDWTMDQALDFLAASGGGLSHDQGLQIAGTFATDPTVIGSLGAAAFARLGVSGARLAALEAKAGRRLLAGEGRITGTERGTEAIRLLSKPYQAIQGTSLGKAAKVTRYIIDPLHAIGQKQTVQEALVDIASEVTPRAVAAAYGEANHLNVLRYGRSVGSQGELYDMLTEDIATYGANVARRILAEQHQAGMMAQGLGYDLLQSVPGDIVDDLAKSAPKGFATYLRDETAKHRVLVWDEPARRNLAARMESMYGFKLRDEYYDDISKMNPDELGLLHAATYGRATKNLLNALGTAVTSYTGNLPLNRLVLLNRDTMTVLGGKGLLEDISTAALTPEATAAGFRSVLELQVALIRDAQTLYPELRYVSIDAANPARSVQRFLSWLENRVDSGVMPMQVTANELATLPPELQNLAEQMGDAWTLGFRPEDHLLWGLEFDLDGGYRAATIPWVDHVADAAPAFRAGAALSYNIAGQPIVGDVLRAAAKPIDYIEAGLRTMRSKVTSATITEGARSRFVAAAATRAGMTEFEAKTVFQGILDAAQVQKTTSRGLTETNMWEQARHLVPQRMYQQGFGKRELMGLVLDAYEGDLRFVGLTQKLTGRAKKLLQPVGGNVAGYIAESLYPTVKFRINAIFQVQERIEPIVLNAQRGVDFVVGNKLNDADRITQGILDRLVETSVVRAGDIDQLEFSALALAGDESKQVLTGHFLRDAWNTLSDVQGVKRVNLLRTFQRGLGGKLRVAWERNLPGTWDDMVAEYSAKAGRVVSDDEAAVRYLGEQMLANEVNVNRLIRPGERAADFDAAINTAAWHVPATLGELRPLELDFLAKRMKLPVEGGKVLLSSNDLRAALAAGTLKWDAIEDALTWYGAHPDYIRRVRNALEFSWDGFWHATVRRFNLEPHELDRLQRMMVRSAEVRGMKPVEFMSQVFSPMIASGTEATIEELGRAVSILRSPVTKDGAKGTPEMLMTQLADVFIAHLDPSAQRALLEVFEKELPGDIQAAMSTGKAEASRDLQRTLEQLRGGWTSDTTGAFAKRILDYVEGVPPSFAFDAVTDAAKGVEQARSVAAGYIKGAGLTVPERRYFAIDEDFGLRTARAYDELPGLEPIPPAPAAAAAAPEVDVPGEVLAHARPMNDDNLVAAVNRLRSGAGPEAADAADEVAGPPQAAGATGAALDPQVAAVYDAFLSNHLASLFRMWIGRMSDEQLAALAQRIAKESRIPGTIDGARAWFRDHGDEIQAADEFGLTLGTKAAGAAATPPPAAPPPPPRPPVTKSRLAKTGLKLKDTDVEPEVRAAYQAFVKETRKQYNAIRAAGIDIVPTTDDPYKNSAEMMADVRDNKRLKVFAGSSDHPLMTDEQNVMFRAVHDYFAHAAEGFQFGPRGELNAAIKHSQMYGPDARRAMLTETHGQNSFVNFSDKPVTPKADPPASDDTLVLDSSGEFADDIEDVPPDHAPDDLTGHFRVGEPNGVGYEFTNQNMSDVIVVAYGPDGKPIGYVRMDATPPGQPRSRPGETTPITPGPVQNIHTFVKPEFRRQGVATRMYDWLRGAGWDIRPASGKTVTAEGRAFTQKYWADRPRVTPNQSTSAPQTVAQVNKAKPGTIYADQKAALLPQDILDEFQAKYIGTGPGREANPDVLRAVQQFGKWSRDALQDGLLSAGNPNPYSALLTRVAGIQTDLAAPFNFTEQMLVNQATHAMRAKEQDAFRLQYFSRERTWLERSVNHPFFGIYPASYMWGKIAPEVIRFIAKEPFGTKTGALAYALSDVQKAVAIQREFDPEFDEHIEKLGHSQAIWFAGYLLPSVPWDIGAAMPAWMRDIAGQGLKNKERVERGQEAKPIDLSRPVRKVADYVSPFRSVFQVERALDEVVSQDTEPEAPASAGTTPPIGPVSGVTLGPTLEEQMQALQQVLADQ